ncbi:TVP38/TMEM64 family protein [Paenibacillus sp. PK3_47]|nr:TVP38/TMEM64 family protein [Paenibacillus sp. PK3_47]
MGVLLLILVIQYLPEIVKLTFSVEDFRDYILSLGQFGPISFILFQILQTVIAPIPGEVIQIAGGYIYGISLGTFYSIIGLLLGAILAFYFTRYLGGEFIKRLLNKEKSKWITIMLDSNKFSVFLFIVFVIPGLPKDFLIFAAGLTPIKPIRFFLILLIARFPWVLASAGVGSNIYQGNYLPTIIISIVAVLAFILGLVFKDKIINALSQKNNK